MTAMRGLDRAVTVLNCRTFSASTHDAFVSAPLLRVFTYVYVLDAAS